MVWVTQKLVCTIVEVQKIKLHDEHDVQGLISIIYLWYSILSLVSHAMKEVGD